MLTHAKHLNALLSICVLTLLGAVTGFPSQAIAHAALIEVIPLQSATLTDEQFLVGRDSAKAVTLAGVLSLPTAGTDRLPVIVLLHVSGGINSAIIDWQQDFLSKGIATFVVDSFAGRGIANTNNDQTQLGRLAQLEDAYRALELLQTHPRINPSRVVLMGISRGGQAMLYGDLKRFERMHGPSGGKFAACIALYPNCNTTYRDDEDLDDKPVRIFHGSADDYAPAAPCRAYAGRLKAKGNDIAMTEYSGARHIFDRKGAARPIALDKAQTVRIRRLVEAADGQRLNAATGQAFTFKDQCVQFRGTSPTTGSPPSTRKWLSINS